MISYCLVFVAATLPAAPRANEDLTRPVMLAQVGPAFPSELNDESYLRWRDFIRPTPKELGFEEVPWRPTFWEAVVEGQQKEMPILVWAMNGHPLACT